MNPGYPDSGSGESASTGHRKFWNDCYQNGQTGWDRGDVHPALLDWLDRGAVEQGTVLIPGCGNGHEAIHLAKHDFYVTAVDIAALPLERLRRAAIGLPGRLEAVNTDFFGFSSDHKFDIIYEQTMLCAIPPELRERYEQIIFRLLKPGGKLLALFAETLTDIEPGPPFHCAWGEMQELFSSDRWQWQAQPPTRYPHPNGILRENACILKRIE